MFCVVTDYSNSKQKAKQYKEENLNAKVQQQQQQQQQHLFTPFFYYDRYILN